MSIHRPIHILGTGNIGRLFAHALSQSRAAQAASPIKLLLRSDAHIAQWHEAGQAIEISRPGGSTSKATSPPLEVEDVRTGTGLIENLIISTKTTVTAEALRPLRHRLNSQSTLVLAQNGMGTLDELKMAFKKKDMPAVLGCVISHGLYSLGPFKSMHAGQGKISLGLMTSGGSQGDEESSRWRGLQETIAQASDLNVEVVDQEELLCLQLEKLVINSVINPLTALGGVENGKLLEENPEMPTAIDNGLGEIDLQGFIEVLVNEAAVVVRKYLTENRMGKIARERFWNDDLLAQVKDVATITAKNKSSMLQDLLAGRETEILYINGWIRRQGRKYGIMTPAHDHIMELVSLISWYSNEGLVNTSGYILNKGY